ncbi:hypothetical protein WJX79_009868 [Trebouxia sp. C0005]
MLPCKIGMAKDPQSTVQRPLGPPDDRYVPKGVKTKSILQWLELKWFQYQITIGTYCFDCLYNWWSQQHIAGSGTAKHPT